MGKKRRHRFHGDPDRFEVVAEFFSNEYGTNIRYIADVAGGQGMLYRLLRKKYNYDCEVVDPRGWTLKGVPNQSTQFDASIADYYDLLWTNRDGKIYTADYEMFESGSIFKKISYRIKEFTGSAVF